MASHLPGPFLSPGSWLCSSGAFPRGLAMEGSLPCVCLPDLSQMGSHVRSGTTLTPVSTPHPDPGELEVGTADVPGGDRVHALFSEVTRAPSSLSLSVPVSLPLSVSLSPPTELRGPPPGRPFSRTLSSLPEALRDPWDAVQHLPECSQARGNAEKEGMYENAQGIRGRKMLTHTATGQLILGFRRSAGGRDRWHLYRKLLHPSGLPQASCGNWEPRGHREDGLMAGRARRARLSLRFLVRRGAGGPRDFRSPPVTLSSPSSWAGFRQPGRAKLGPSFALLVPTLQSEEDIRGRFPMPG